MAVLDHAHGTYRPRIGLSEGWLPGEVMKVNMTAADTKKTKDSNNKVRVIIKSTWPYFVTALGEFCCANDTVKV